ncbi:hypothetical protein RB653_000352 [Dictyostelium firmibasis]|uniref:Uncharacterized protein n=1 Tax=Dictyostelium firmibasis TaxID=79012 RepID=A0AAN7YUA2_9MYCE
MKYIIILSIFIIGLLFVNSQTTDPTFPKINPNYVSYVSYNNYIEGFTFSSKEYNLVNANQNITVHESEDVTIYSDWKANTTSIHINSTWYNFPSNFNIDSSYSFLNSENFKFIRNESIDRGFECSVFGDSINSNISSQIDTIENFNLTKNINITAIASQSGDSCFNGEINNVVFAIFTCVFEDDKTKCSVSYTTESTTTTTTSSSSGGTGSTSDSTPTTAGSTAPTSDSTSTTAGSTTSTSDSTPTTAGGTTSTSDSTPTTEGGTTSTSDSTPTTAGSTTSTSDSTPTTASGTTSTSDSTPTTAGSTASTSDSTSTTASSESEPTTSGGNSQMIKLLSENTDPLTTQCTFNGILNKATIETFGEYNIIKEGSFNFDMQINANVTAYISLPNNIPVRITFKGQVKTSSSNVAQPVDLNIGFVDWTLLEALPSSFIKPNCTDNKCNDLPNENQHPSFVTPTIKTLEAATILSLVDGGFAAVSENVVNSSLVSVKKWYHDHNLQMDAFIIEETMGEIYSISNSSNSLSVNTFTLSCNNNLIKTTDMIDETLVKILTNSSQYQWTLGERTIRRSVDVDQWNTTIDGKSVNLFTFARGWQFLFRHGLNSSTMSIPVAVEIISGDQNIIKRELDIFLYDILPIPTKIKDFNAESCTPTLPIKYDTMVTMNNLKYGYTQQYQEIYSSIDGTTLTIGKYHTSDLHLISNKNKSVSQWSSTIKCKTFDSGLVINGSLYSSSLAQQISDIYRPTLSMSYLKLSNTTHQWTGSNSTHIIVYTWLVNGQSVSPIKITISLIDSVSTNILQTFEFNSFSTSSITNVIVPTNCSSITKSDKNVDNLQQQLDDEKEQDTLYGPRSFSKDYVLPNTVDTKNHPKVSNIFTINIQVTTTEKNGKVSKSNNVVWKYSQDKLAESYSYTNKVDSVQLCFTDSSMNIANISLNGSNPDGPYSNAYYDKYFFGDNSIAKLFTDQSFLNQFTISENYTLVEGLKLVTLSKSNDSTIYYFPIGWTFETFDSTSELSTPLLISKVNGQDGSTETWKIIKYDNTVDSDLYSKCQPIKKGGIHIDISKNGIIAVVIIVVVVLAGVGAIVFIVIKKRGGLGKKMPAHILLDEQEQNRTYEN